MIDRSYLPFQSAREHKDRGMMKWMGFFLSEHTSSLHEDKTKENLTSHLEDQGRRCRCSGYVVDLDFDQVTIKSCKRHKCILTKDILGISLEVENIDEEEKNL